MDWFLPHECLVNKLGWDLSYLVLEFAEVDPVKWNLNNQIVRAKQLHDWYQHLGEDELYPFRLVLAEDEL